MAGSGGGAGRCVGREATDREREREREREPRLCGGVRTRPCAEGERRSFLIDDRPACRGDGGGDRRPDLVGLTYSSSADIESLSLSPSEEVE